MQFKGSSHFIIGGAPRSGTTWLYQLLEMHPEIYLAQPPRPEPKFFLVDAEFDRGIEYYFDRWFPSGCEGKISGEKSANYLEDSRVAGRIRQFCPNSKLIFILREPTSRAYSNYLWSKMNGLESEEFSIALDMEEEREINLPDHLQFAKPFSYYSRGLYEQHLAPYIDLFPREQILCLRFEDVMNSPESLARRIHQFLGAEIRPEDAAGLGIVNPASNDGDTIPPDCEELLRRRYVEPNRKLAALLGSDFVIWD